MTNNIKQHGLYVPQAESDSCGVGMMADLNGKPTHYIVDAAITILERMEHRGACGCEEDTGDGAGILLQIPDEFLRKELSKRSIELPTLGKYGVGMFFMPKNKEHRAYCDEVINKYANKLDFKIIATRNVPTNNGKLGPTAVDSEPDIVQLFFKTDAFNYKSIERRLFYLRSNVMKDIYADRKDLCDDFYVCSLSSKTIVYKGLLTATQLRGYFNDLSQSNFTSAVAIVHSRFSTNTLPQWKLAQPFRCIAHNGEINTVNGNLARWRSKENNLRFHNQSHPKFVKAMPICDPYLSDSGNFDNVVDFLLRASRSIPHTMMMMIPEAWQNDPHIDPNKKAFYEYHDAIMEPWDGPASICFTDGNLLGATLDRNGLRPSRYLITTDNILILGSEAGCLEIDPKRILKKGRLEPGKMLVADLEEKRIISDEELKVAICTRKPYKEWLDKYAKHIDDLELGAAELEVDNLLQKQQVFGLSLEDEDLLLKAMLVDQKEPIGSMGADIPLAVFSKIAQHLANYFKQQFAQVTNPPIDPLRENFYMSLSTTIGAGSQFLGTNQNQAKVLRFDSPILTIPQKEAVMHLKEDRFRSEVIDLTYEDSGYEDFINAIWDQVQEAIKKGIRIICLSDKGVSAKKKPIPSLLVVGALHHRLIADGIRKEVTLLVESGDVWEAHHSATLLSYGADLICPYLAMGSCVKLAKEIELTSEDAVKNYIKAVDKALLKIMSKLGISTLSSYKGAQTFEALGIAQEVVDVCFKGTVTRIGGMGFSDLQKENEVKHKVAFGLDNNELPDLGNYQWKKRGEYHLFNPQSIHLLQHSTSTNDYKTYKKFSRTIDDLEQNASTLRSFLRIKKGRKSIDIDSVEPVEQILKRFATGAMSLGSISHEAHSTLAKAMNRIGGKSNSGEGGEDDRRFMRKADGDWERSAIKQVASGRFGVDINYLNNAEELQIKVAQGAKPGEGGQLPGHKVNGYIGKVRNATPGVGLISPPPHHDIYSIEDLAQLIFDLKNANDKARISVKLVSKAGIGVIASGVAKAHAEHILVSGFDGGTGASPLSSIRHAGLPWELGLAETHQTLIKNGLRDRVVLQTDGQIRSGRDLAIATMLGAEEWGIATAALVVEGCILMRKCHLNTCPVGIATQDPDLIKKFTGQVDHVVNYFYFLANHLREIMAECGVRTINELVGRTDLLEIDGLQHHWKHSTVSLEPLLFKQANSYETDLYGTKAQEHNLDNVLDRRIIEEARDAIDSKSDFYSVYDINNENRAVGTLTSSHITRKYGKKGLPPRSITLRFQGSAGQSFGAFTCKGMQLYLEGEANDYFGKGLCGGILSVTVPSNIKIKAAENTIIGNVALYGATKGEVYINGIAGDRFAVRNSGAHAVVEGLGDNGCEYMTGGKVMILGAIGRNFAAGMSGGIVYGLEEYLLPRYINNDQADIEKPSTAETEELFESISTHFRYTGSKLGKEILAKWEEKYKHKFIRIIPSEYKEALRKRDEQLVSIKKAV